MLIRAGVASVLGVAAFPGDISRMRHGDHETRTRQVEAATFLAIFFQALLVLCPCRVWGRPVEPA